jgi:hypothetical protein
MVGGREIPVEAIAAEAQHHPAPDAAYRLECGSRKP